MHLRRPGSHPSSAKKKSTNRYNVGSRTRGESKQWAGAVAQW